MKKHVHASIKHLFATGLLLMTALVLPLFAKHLGGGAIIADKLRPVPLIMCLGLTGCVWLVFKGAHKRRLTSSMTLLDWMVLLFALSSLITSSHCPNWQYAMKGGLIHCGTPVYVCGALSYFVISRGFSEKHKAVIWWMLVTGWTFLYIWCFLNAFGVGYVHTAVPDKPSMVATLGHVNTASAFFCITLPVLALQYLDCESTWARRIHAGMLTAGILASLSIFTDGIWLGMTLAASVLLYAAAKSTLKLQRLCILTLLSGIAFSVIHLSLTLGIIRFEKGLTWWLATHFFGEALCTVSALLLALKGKWGTQKEAYTTLGKILAAACVLLVSVVVVWSIVQSIRNPYFGTCRGAVWKGSIWTYRLYSPTEKIIGQGSGMFFEKLTVATNMLLGRKYPNTIYASCHNFLLESLLSQGIVGMLILITGIVALFIAAKKSIEKNKFSKTAIPFSAIMGYLGLSFVNSPYNYTVLLLYVMLALFRNYSSARNEDHC